MTATTYFSISSTDITNELCPDTSMTSANIESLAQRVEYEVMHRIGLSAAPSGATASGALKYAIILLTASQIESRDPHSFQDGGFSAQKMSRFDWTKKADEIIRRFRSAKIQAWDLYDDSSSST